MKIDKVMVIAQILEIRVYLILRFKSNRASHKKSQKFDAHEI